MENFRQFSLSWQIYDAQASSEIAFSYLYGTIIVHSVILLPSATSNDFVSVNFVRTVFTFEAINDFDLIFSECEPSNIYMNSSQR